VRTWGIVATLVGHTFAGGDASQTSGETLLTYGLVLMPYGRPSNTIRVAMILPDGVPRVTATSVSLGGQRWPENVTAAVHDNVAAVALRTPGSRFDGLPIRADPNDVVRLSWQCHPPDHDQVAGVGTRGVED
jgi:hypothetical protein